MVDMTYMLLRELRSIKGNHETMMNLLEELADNLELFQSMCDDISCQIEDLEDHFPAIKKPVGTERQELLCLIPMMMNQIASWMNTLN